MLDLCMFAEGAYWQEEIAAMGDRARSSASCRARRASGPERRNAPFRDRRQPARAEGADRGGKSHVDAQVLRAGDHHGATYFQHQRFRRAVLEGAPVEVTMEDGLKAVAIGLAAERSIQESARLPSMG